MGNAARRNRIAEGAHDRLLPDQLGKGLRPVFAGKNAILLYLDQPACGPGRAELYADIGTAAGYGLRTLRG